MDVLARTPVVTCFLQRRGRILLLRRSDRVGTYRGRWAGVSGYVERVPLEQAFVEVAEEAGLGADDVALQGVGAPTPVDDPAQDRHWLVYPFVFTVKPRRAVRTDWESVEARWIEPRRLADYDTVPGLAVVLRAVWPAFGNAKLWNATRQIAADRLSGSTHLAAGALQALQAFAKTKEAREDEALARAARALAAIRPSMGVIAHVMARAVLVPAALQSRAVDPHASGTLLGELEAATCRSGELAAQALAPFRCLLTYSASAVCEDALRKWARGREDAEVIVAESRPKLEGAALAGRLAKGGVNVRLVTDAQLGLAVRQAEALLVGADAVTDDDRLLNKVGTETVVMLARESGVPAYAVCQTLKVAPPGWPLALERQEPADVHEAADFRVQNVAFDATPLDRFTRVITEQGDLTPPLLRRIRRELAASPLVPRTAGRRPTSSHG